MKTIFTSIFILLFGLIQTSAQGDPSKPFEGYIFSGFEAISLTAVNLHSNEVSNWGCVGFDPGNGKNPDPSNRNYQRPYFTKLPDHHLQFAMVNNFEKDFDYAGADKHKYKGDVLEVKAGGYSGTFFAFVNGTPIRGTPEWPRTDPNPPGGTGKAVVAKINGKTTDSDIISIPKVRIINPPKTYGSMDISQGEIDSCLSRLSNEVPLLLPVVYNGDKEAYYEKFNLTKSTIYNFDLVFFKHVPNPRQPDTYTWYAAAINPKVK